MSTQNEFLDLSKDNMRRDTEWADICDEERSNDFQRYVTNIAEAKYVIRRVLRIVDEEAKKHGLEPLLHQALLQIYGYESGRGINVGTLARRLDVASAFASRLVRRLEDLALVRRERSENDRRSTLVSATPEGVETLSRIDSGVHFEVAYLQRQLSTDQRTAAMSIFAFYVGLDMSSPIAAAIRQVAAT
jgi:DNA-binding MarR family transcriptional regulator